ncbi:MAG TPA: glycosyltransferase 87 family protein [Streptosporangiaceae bacterium]|nr:glycosyltransferase 87 family protein [Streptosporangiaceae bacterium]
MLAASSALGIGLVLFLLAQWRGWQPSLPTALAVGAALRGAVWAVAASQAWQPKDFRLDFHAAAVAVLHHHDPLLSGRPRGWPFLPTMAFVLAGELKLGQATHLPWPVVGRLAPVVADLILIPLIGKLATDRGPLRRFQYACNPLVILICAMHGQLEPEVLVLGVAAFVVARSHRSTAAGILLGFCVAIGVWSVLLAPGVLLMLPDGRKRLRAACVAASVPIAFLVTSPLTVGTPARLLPTVAHRIIGLRSVIGGWGWTVALTRGRLEFLTSAGRLGVVALTVALVAAAYLWRRADPVDLTAALLITFLVVSPRVSVQYLVWPMPFLAARMTRFATPAIVAASVWAGISYLALGPGRAPTSWHAHTLAYWSWAVIPVLILAMPWERRHRDGRFGPVFARPAAEPAAETTAPGARVGSGFGASAADNPVLSQE